MLGTLVKAPGLEGVPMDKGEILFMFMPPLSVELVLTELDSIAA